MIDFSDTDQISGLFQKAVAKALEKHAKKGESVAVSDENGNVQVVPVREMSNLSIENNILPILKLTKKIQEKAKANLFHIWHVSDREIEKGLSQDIDYIRVCLKKMKYLSLITTGEGGEPNSLKIKEITSEGELLIKGKISATNFLVNQSREPGIRYFNINNYHENIEGNYIQQSHPGNGDNIGGDKNITYTNQNPELDKIITEIQRLLDQQAEEFNPTTEKGQQRITTATIQEIENNPNLAQRIVNASEKGLIEYMKARFISPVQSAFLAALEDWYQTRSQK